MNTRLIILGVVVGCATGPFARAAEAPVPLEEIVVTATRHAEDADALAQSVTIIRRGDQPSDFLITEALQNAVGVYVQQTTPGQGAPIIRGLRGSSVLHLVDGMRLNNAIFRSAPTQYFALVPASSVDRVEVLRGTSASVYGTDAVAGVVNAVTRRPELQEAGWQSQSSLDVRLDSASETRALAAGWSFGDSILAGDFSAEYQVTNDRRIGGGSRVGPSGFEAWGGRAALSGALSEDWIWLADLQFMEQPSTPRVDELVPGFGQTQPSSSEFAFAPNRRTFFHAQTSRRDGWLNADWNIDLAWQRIDDDRRTRDLDAPTRLLEQNTSDLYGLSVVANRDRDGERVRWVAGLDHYADRVTSGRWEQQVASGAVQSVMSRFPDGSRVRQTSLFAEMQIENLGRWHWGGGIRFSSSRAVLARTEATPETTTSVNDLGIDLSLRYELSEALNWVTTLGAGFRAPNIFDLGTLGARPGNRFNVPNASLESERVQHLDTGLRYRTDRARFELVGFYLHYDDRIASVLTGAQTPGGRDVVQSANVSTSDILGIEFGLEYRLTPAWRLNAVLNATRGEQRQRGQSDEPGDRIPPVNASLAINRYTDNYRAEFMVRSAASQTRLSARDLRDIRIDPGGTPGWVAADLGLEWFDVGGWQINAGVENLLDHRYRNHGSGIDAPGRNLYLSLRTTF
ncbi:MAG: TonB-dependent receptor [Pseudomonadota bacterium]